MIEYSHNGGNSMNVEKWYSYQLVGRLYYGFQPLARRIHIRRAPSIERMTLACYLADAGLARRQVCPRHEAEHPCDSALYKEILSGPWKASPMSPSPRNRRCKVHHVRAAAGCLIPAAAYDDACAHYRFEAWATWSASVRHKRPA